MSVPDPTGDGPRLVPAGQSRRAAAALVDLAVWAPVAVVVWRRQRGRDPGERPPWPRRVLLRIPMCVYVVGSTLVHGGTPGYRVLGLRVVDRATGERPGWRQACLRWAAATIPSAIAGEAMRAYSTRRIDPWAGRSTELHEQVERLRVERSEDDDHDRALDSLTEQLNVGLADAFKVMRPLALYAAWWVATFVMARRDSQRRTLRDRFAGTMVVRARGRG